MNNLINYAISGVDGATKGDFAAGGIIAIVAVIMVFLVLLLIIVLTEIASKAISSATKEEVKPVVEPTTTTVSAPTPVRAVGSPLNINDEDATVAALVASIDYRAETGMNIRVVSVKEVG